MNIYVEGVCVECGNRIAAAVKHDEESWRKDIAEFVENGYRVELIETSGRVEVEAHKSTCSYSPSKVEGVSPKDAGELWRHKATQGYFHTDYSTQDSMLCLVGYNGRSRDADITHNENWERLFPYVERQS